MTDLPPDLLPEPVDDADALVRSWETDSSSAWLPSGLNEAEWAARKLAQARALYAELDAEVEEYERRVTAWANAKRTTGYGGQLLRTVRFFEDRLRLFGILSRERSPLDAKGEPMMKTIELPSATIRTRKVTRRKAVPGHFEMADESLITWCEANAPDVLTTHVNMAALERRLMRHPSGSIVDGDTGEIVPGVRYVAPVEAEHEVTASVEVREL